MNVIGVLDMADLAPRVRAAFADGRIPSYLSGEKDFDRLPPGRFGAAGRP